MPAICRCQAYGYAQHMYTSLFFKEDPEKGSPGSSSAPPARCSTETQDVAAQPAAVATRCCVMTLPCDAARCTGKQRYDYSLTVVHFRKVMNRQKIGSPENSCPVIYHGGYMVANYKNGYDFVW